MDVMDSFASRTLREIAHMIRLLRRGDGYRRNSAEVAFAMVQLGLTLEGVATAPGLGRSLAYLNEKFNTRLKAEPPVSAGEIRVAESSPTRISYQLARRAG